MSWLERVEVQLRPSSVSIRRAALWSSGSAVGAQVLPVHTHPGEPAEAWREPLQVLARAFEGARERGSALHVVLSDHFARFAVVPWSADLVRESERIAFARLTFSQTFGPLSDGWDIALDDSLQARPAIAAAIDRSLLQALRELCASRRMRLASVVPAFVRDVNRQRSALRGDNFWVARVESGRLTLALRQAGAWAAVRTRRLDGTGPDALASALRQEAIACGVPPQGMVFLLGAGAVQSIPGWSVTPLGTSSGTATVPPAGRAAAAK